MSWWMRKSGDEKGFTLIEGLVSILLLSITAVGVFNTIIVSQKFIADARYVTEATNFARKKLERILGCEFQNITQTYSASKTYDANPYDDHYEGLYSDPDCDCIGDSNSSLTYAEWKVEYPGSSSDPLEIRLTVSWQESPENDRKYFIQLSTKATEGKLF